MKINNNNNNDKVSADTLTSSCLISTLLWLCEGGEGCYFFTVAKQRKHGDIRRRNKVKEKEVMRERTRGRVIEEACLALTHYHEVDNKIIYEIKL